jgi:DNA-binding HxlR family transcriptional regulator
MSKTCEADGGAVHQIERTSLSWSLLNLLTSKWSVPAIAALADNSLRFGALQRQLRGVSPKVLTRNLRRLEEFGLVKRVVYPTVPLHVEYSLTEPGRGVAKLLQEVETWYVQNEDLLLQTSVPQETPSATVNRGL